MRPPGGFPAHDDVLARADPPVLQTAGDPWPRRSAMIEGVPSVGPGAGSRIVVESGAVPLGVAGKAGLADTRRHNLGLVLRTLFDGGELSRAEIGRRTLLTKVSVSDLVSELLADGLVEELERRSLPGRGKPATPYRVAPAGRAIVVLDLADPGHLRGGVVDVRGEFVHRDQRPVPSASLDAADVATFAAALAAASDSPVLGIGIGTPGVSGGQGVIASAPRLGWRDVPLAAMVEAATSLPVVTINDADCAALAERRYGGAAANMLLVQLAAGVGAGVLIDGRVVRGAYGMAGEIGHVVVDPGGAPCPCGKRGCLEIALSAPALTRAMAAAGPDTHSVLEAAAGRLALVVSPVVAMLDLAEIVVAGTEAAGGAPLLTAFARHVQAALRVDFRPDVTVRAARLGNDAVLRGAAASVLAERLLVY